MSRLDRIKRKRIVLFSLRPVFAVDEAGHDYINVGCLPSRSKIMWQIAVKNHLLEDESLRYH